MSIFNDKAGARKLYLRLKIFLWLGGLTYFALLGAGRLHAGEAKPSSGVEWERTVEAAKREGKVVVSIPASAELRKGIEKVFKQRFGIEPELNVGRAASIVGRIQQESKSGVPYFDVHMGGSESMVTGLLSEGIFSSPRTGDDSQRNQRPEQLVGRARSGFPPAGCPCPIVRGK